MIKNIIFDCSDTLLHFEARKVLAEKLGGDMERATNIHRITYGCAAFRRYSVGTISYGDAKPQALALLDECDRAAGEEFLETRMVNYRPIEGMAELVNTLKKNGYRLYILSDFPDYFEQLWERFEVFRQFDGRCVSYEAHASKSDGLIFEVLIDRYSLDPSECVFVDDTEANTLMSETYGMKGITFRSAEDTRGKLGALGVNV